MNKHLEIVTKGMAYIKANLDKPFSVPEMAKELGISNGYLLKVFRAVLNQSVVDCIRVERIAKAKALLQQTNLSITSVAFESGFESCSFFTRTFRKKVGTTPQDFRKKVQQLKEAPITSLEPMDLEKKEEWFKDFFHTKNLEPHWKPIAGKWRQEQACLTGTGASNSIALFKALPENCRISLKVKPQEFPQLGEPSIDLKLVDETHQLCCYNFTLATGNRATGQLVHFRTGSQWNQNARLKEDAWHVVVLEIKEGSFLLLVNGIETFSFRDAFPPAYSSRCYLHLESWHCKLSVRELAIHNLGFLPVIRPIQQGDVLYNSGMADKAMNFYLRYLQAGAASDEETMELRYKIGMCCLQSGAYSQAKGWMDKVVLLRDNRFWAEQAQLSLLVLYWKTADMVSLLEHLRLCFANAKIQALARVTLQTAVHDFLQRGFYEEAGQVLQEWVSLEPPFSFGHQIAQRDLAENFLKVRQKEDAEQILLGLVSNSRIDEMVLYSRVNLMQLYHEWGKIRESENIRTEIECRTKNQFVLMRCAIQQALNYHAEGQFEPALKVLAEIPSRFGQGEPGLLCFAKIHSAFILCCMGRLEEGRRTLEEANAIAPGRIRSWHQLPFFLIEANYKAAAESLLSDYRNSKELVSSSAELGIKGGILHELAGMDVEAKSIFKEVSLRFPNEQVRFFGLLAKTLAEERVPLTLSVSKCEQAEEEPASSFDKLRMSEHNVHCLLQFLMEMPYEAHRRSEMFYLLGLLKEKRGEMDAARALFELSVKEDPALRWPAFFAAKKLSP